jgi:hypothetical protein
MDGLCRPVPVQTWLEVGSDRCQWAYSASCTVAMVCIFASWWYILSTPSVVDEGKALEVLVAAASVWPPSWLAEGAAPLAQAWVPMKSTIRILSTLGEGSCHDGLSGRATAILCLPVRLFYRYVVSCLVLGCQARACIHCHTWGVHRRSKEGPRCQRLWLNRHHRPNGRGILLPQWGCDRSRRSPHAKPPRRGEAGAPYST